MDLLSLPVLTSSTTLDAALLSLFWIGCALVVSPVVVRASRGVVPDVVVLLVLGCLLGPSVLALAEIGPGVELVRELGLGLLFLLAGTEIDPATLRAKQGRQAILTWILCLALALGVAWAFIPDATFAAAAVLAIAVTSTALGALLPILKDRGQLDSPLGTAVLTHGAVGELMPIMAMALLLSTRTTWASALVLLAFFLVAAVVAVVPHRLVMRVPGIRAALVEGVDTTAQTAVRVTFWLLLTLMAAASVFELDVVLGAFAAGFIVRAVRPEGFLGYEERLEAIAYGFFIPVFFVTSGMNVDVAAVAEQPVLLLVFVAMILVIRGGVVWLRERLSRTGSGLTGPGDRRRLALYAATGLPIIVAVTELGVSRELMPEDIAAVLVAAGALTVLVFPFLARPAPGRGTAQPGTRR
ncbi:cation:proton antiporter [Serinicoccus kebangsaanensis]|uniref:cation:proton antiporter n=1 Tax=Serinicoccus kebangsaanensis TaxID=2602069 RepID=UPI001EE2FC6A|nr:cation:proton antiporter [Serinicoccus kebangsaanensis]